eukprot:CAMPEP_0196660888 /NCGR_PEP_ID=MMETSP1086-20130531/41710_1 /TAXON_ID=77921 /ORGANISM="Cyanoptyche  gloeocystis , Strain SAG4.97" /LENGTH=304 /DNA_ID=CAMNT_0041995529 /DNA_START=311 /DNA_END=1226 /DNA_ORIENTATION=+
MLQDKEAYVWHLEDDRWVSTLIPCKLGKGATCIKWSPKEDKLAVGSAGGAIVIAWPEAGSNWWVTKSVREGVSSIVRSISWHPDNLLLASGTTANTILVHSVAVSSIDGETGMAKIGTLIHEAHCKGWVHGVAWSPCGRMLAAVAHDATLTVLDMTNAPPVTQEVSHTGLPLVALAWVGTAAIVAAGHEFAPFLFSRSTGKWAPAAKVDDPQARSKVSNSSSSQSQFASALTSFKSRTERGQTADDTHSTILPTRHQNLITEVCCLGAPPEVPQISTVGLDGKLIVWDLSSFSSFLTPQRGRAT